MCKRALYFVFFYLFFLFCINGIDDVVLLWAGLWWPPLLGPGKRKPTDTRIGIGKQPGLSNETSYPKPWSQSSSPVLGASHANDKTIPQLPLNDQTNSHRQPSPNPIPRANPLMQRDPHVRFGPNGSYFGKACRLSPRPPSCLGMGGFDDNGSEARLRGAC